MAVISRREAGKILVAGAAGLIAARATAFGAEQVDSVVRGVQIGAQSYSFRDRKLDACIQGYVDCGLGECELWQGHVEPGEDWKNREALRKWRLEAPLSLFHDVRGKFDKAGVKLYAYNYSFNKHMTDAEFDRGFQFAQALGASHITASSQVSIARKVDEYAKKYKIMVGFHGHDNTKDPDEFSTPDTFKRAMQGASEYIGINLDIGHFTAAGGDAVAYLGEQHAKIVTLHIKDRKKDHGANVPFGQGDTPIGAVLKALRDNHWKIPANIEYEYGEEMKGLDTIAEVKKCLAYCKKEIET